MTITWAEIAKNTDAGNGDIEQYEEWPNCPFCHRGDEYRFAITLTGRVTYPMYPPPHEIDSADIKNMVSLHAALECTQCNTPVATAKPIRCRPDCFRITTSNRSGSRRRRRALGSAGAEVWGMRHFRQMAASPCVPVFR